MTEMEFIEGGIVVLALVGYYHCLWRKIGLTLILSAGFATYLYGRYPFEGNFLPYWAAAGIGVLLLAGLAWYNRPRNPQATLPKRSTPAHPKKRVQGTAKQRKKKAKNTPTQHTKIAPQKKEIVIDGTNVLYWDGDGAQMSTLRLVVDYLKQKDYGLIVFLDASSRHHLGDKSLNEGGFARALGLPQSKIMVCPAKTEADAFILKFAKQEGLPVLSNDRFSDRATQAKGLRIIKGVIAAGRPILDGL